MTSLRTPCVRTETGMDDSTARIGGRSKLCIALLAILGFSLGTSEFIVIGIQPELSEYFNIPLAQTGLLMSAFSITYAVATPILALSTGRISRRTLLITYAVLFIAGNAAAAFAPSFEMLLASRILIGLVSGALLAVGVTYIPELVGMSRLSWCISLVYAAFSVSMVVATSVGKFVAAALDWHLALVAALALSVVSCAAIIFVMPDRGTVTSGGSLREQLPLLADARMLLGMAIFMFGVGSVYVFYGYVTPYLEDMLGMDALTASGALMAYGIACFVSNLLSGALDTRFGIKALVATFPVQAVLLLCLWAFDANMPAAFAVILGIGLTMYLVSTPCVTLFMSTARTEYPQALTLASSLEPTALNIGIALGTAVGGTTISSLGMGAVGIVGAALSLAACGLTVLTVHAVRRGGVRTAPIQND